MEDALKKLGFQVFPSQANYIFFRDPFKENQKSLYSRMEEQRALPSAFLHFSDPAVQSTATHSYCLLLNIP